MQDKVEPLAGAANDRVGEVNELNQEVGGLDRRLVRIETLVKVAKAQGKGNYIQADFPEPIGGALVSKPL